MDEAKKIIKLARAQAATLRAGSRGFVMVMEYNLCSWSVWNGGRDKGFPHCWDDLECDPKAGMRRAVTWRTLHEATSAMQMFRANFHSGLDAPSTFVVTYEEAEELLKLEKPRKEPKAGWGGEGLEKAKERIERKRRKREKIAVKAAGPV
jgi:hypothetical protein